MAERTCALCGRAVTERQRASHFRVEGDLVGFGRVSDRDRYFHDDCLTEPEGIDERARAQVLDYLEAFQKSQATLQDLKVQNLERAQKLLKEIEWRKKYPT
jgi:hypothetical protein